MPDVVITSEEGIIDFAFPLETFEEAPDGTISLHVRGTQAGKDVGFSIDLLPEWQQQIADEGALTLYWGKVRYRSIGAPSDKFLRLLANRYGVPLRHRAMVPMVEFTAVGLMTDPRDFKSTPASIKLFFEPEVDEDSQSAFDDVYAEVFTTIDFAQATVGFNEKDQSYRAQLVAALSDTQSDRPVTEPLFQRLWDSVARRFAK